MKPGKRIVSAVFLVDGLAFLVFLALAAYERNANVIIPSYAFRWELSEAFLDFVRWLPVLQFLALALALGSTAGKAEDLFRDSILPGVVLSAILAAGALVICPSMETRRYSYLDLSGRFNEALASTRAGLVDGRLIDARVAYGALKAIDRLDPRAVDLESRLVAAELKAARDGTPAPAQSRPAQDPGAAKTHLAQAEDYFRQRDFYSANWHARKACELDPGLGAARLVADRSWGEILASGGTAADAAKAAFFGRKVEAFGHLQAGDAVTAYRLFSEMAREDPMDADVRRYLTESLAAIETSGFFKDEADEAAAARVFPRFFVLVPRQADATGQAQAPGGKSPPSSAVAPIPGGALAAREIAFTPEAVFFFDLEYIVIGRDGSEVFHVSTPYAKLTSGKLFLRAVERDRPATIYTATMADGSAAPLFIETGLEVLPLYRLAAGLRLPASVSTIDLFQGAVLAPHYGLSRVSYMTELLKRLGLPFALFGAAALGTLVGIRFRPASGKPSKGSWLALPVMIAMAGLAFLALDSADALLSGWVLRILPGPLALAASAGLRTAVLALLVIIAASLRRHVPENEAR